MTSILDLNHQVSQTLGDFTADYDIDAIVVDVIAANAGVVPDSIDVIDSETYNAILERWDTTVEPEACQGHAGEDDMLISGAGMGETAYCDGSCNP